MEEKVENVTEEVIKVDMSKTETVDDGITKVDLSKPPTPIEEKNETKEDNPIDKGVVAEPDNAEPTEKQEEVQPEEQAQEDTPVLEEVTDEEEVKEETEVLTEEVKEAVAEAQETGTPLPENIQKVVEFMEETGGTLDDYVRLNQDFSSYDDITVLREYYKQTKSHLSQDEIDFLIEDSFAYNEEEDEERDVKKKKIALKEQVASAKSHLDGQKSKYYEEIKAGSRLTPEAQKAMNFFNRYNKESEETQKVAKQQTDNFLNKTNQVFNDKFKGFEYNIGEKKYRFNVKNAGEIKDTQSDINNFVKKFLNEKNEMSDAKGYHKSLFTAMNADAIANHFYEQGKTDAMKNSVTKAKNVDMNPRQQHGVVEAGGIKVKVLGDDSSSFKFKIKNNK
tara:strand:+ start:34 stop:1209 length:1176 start_codon:yes stop_codon:yes gene_type:complete